MKKFVLGLLIGVMLSIGITTYAIPEIKEAKFSPDIKLVVNGKQVDTQIVSVIKSGEVNTTNYVSARSLAESLNANVEWDGKSKTITVTTSSNENETIQESSTQSSKEVVVTPQVTQPVTTPSTPTNTQTTSSTSTTTKSNIPHKILSTDDYGVNVYYVYNTFELVFIGEVRTALENKGYKLVADSYDTVKVMQGDNKIVSGIWIGSYGNKIYLKNIDYIEYIKPILLQ